MAEQRSLASSVAQAELFGLLPASKERLAVKTAVPDINTGIGRPFSGPTSLELPSPDKTAVAKTKGKRAAQEDASSDVAAYRTFRRLCDDIIGELSKINRFLQGEEVTDVGWEVVVEVEELLEKLYDCPWGRKEALKRVVVAVQSQVNNVQWSRRHVDFVNDVISFLRVRYLVDDGAVDACYEMMKHRGLDPFRGTICKPQVVKKFHIEESREG